jgi:methyl-accepting chemotaxis protein
MEEIEHLPAQRSRRLAGYALIVTAALGVVLSIGGLIALLTLSTVLRSWLDGQLALVSQALEASADGLAVADQAVADSQAAIGSLQTTLGGVTTTISDTLPAIDSTTSLVGVQLPGTVDATIIALNSAQEAADAADRILRTLSTFGLLGRDRYDPAVPLGESVGGIATSIATVNEDLERIADDLRTTRGNLETLNGDLAEMNTAVGAIGNSVGETRAVLASYQAIIDDLQGQIAGLREALPQWLTIFTLIAVLFLIWLFFAQIALWLQGRALLEAA